MKRVNAPSWSPDEDKIAMDMYSAGAYQRDIAKCLNRTESAIKNRLNYLREVRGESMKMKVDTRAHEHWPPEPVEWPAMARFEDVKLPPSTLLRFRPVYRPTVFSNMGCAADMCTEA